MANRQLAEKATVTVTWLELSGKTVKAQVNLEENNKIKISSPVSTSVQKKSTEVAKDYKEEKKEEKTPVAPKKEEVHDKEKAAAILKPEEHKVVDAAKKEEKPPVVENKKEEVAKPEAAKTVVMPAPKADLDATREKIYASQSVMAPKAAVPAAPAPMAPPVSGLQSFSVQKPSNTIEFPGAAKAVNANQGQPKQTPITDEAVTKLAEEVNAEKADIEVKVKNIDEAREVLQKTLDLLEKNGVVHEELLEERNSTGKEAAEIEAERTQKENILVGKEETEKTLNNRLYEMLSRTAALKQRQEESTKGLRNEIKDNKERIEKGKSEIKELDAKIDSKDEVNKINQKLLDACDEAIASYDHAIGKKAPTPTPNMPAQAAPVHAAPVQPQPQLHQQQAGPVLQKAPEVEGFGPIRRAA